jgi:hypothetical protein
MKRRRVVLGALLLAAPAGLALAQQPVATSCIACHSDTELWDAEGLRPVQGFAQDIHAEAGLSCHDCHGGNPDPALAGDAEAAMDAGYKPNPFRKTPTRGEIPDACGRCHSDATYMKRFNPSLRVDQEQEYWTSQHGRALRRGDAGVATCVDCHGVHGILSAGNPLSPVYPTHVAETCKGCHADAQRMQGRRLPDGRALPVDQYARWQRSVHARSLLERGDLSAPTCNDCHGNHGATPPGLESIALVCGQCHGREAQLFRASPKQAGFENHEALLADAGEAGCAACHEAPAPQAKLKGPHVLSECTSCHGNHGVVRPTVALLSPLPETPCAFCHEGPDSVASEVPEPEKKRRNYTQLRDVLLAEATGRQLAGAERFDFLVDRALTLPTHVLAAGSDDTRAGQLRPEFERLFTKFRIGKTYYTYEDPATGQPARAEIVRCTDCHETEPDASETPTGLGTARDFLSRMRELTALTARAERILLAARRGGVETRGTLLEIDHAVDAQIELEVLVHTFSSAEGGAFLAKHAEGLEHARVALAGGQRALDELSARRRGLYVSLVFIGLVLAGLGLKIRELSRRRAAESAAG